MILDPSVPTPFLPCFLSFISSLCLVYSIPCRQPFVYRQPQQAFYANFVYNSTKFEKTVTFMNKSFLLKNFTAIFVFFQKPPLVSMKNRRTNAPVLFTLKPFGCGRQSRALRPNRTCGCIRGCCFLSIARDGHNTFFHFAAAFCRNQGFMRLLRHTKQKSILVQRAGGRAITLPQSAICFGIIRLLCG